MSFTGLKTINASDINNQGLLRLGSDLETGSVGQVVQSQGDNLPAIWGPNSAILPNALTMGTNLSLLSGNASFDGSIADTINSAGLGLTGGNGISIVGGTDILTDNDNTTINNSGGTGQQNQVLKVPNALTAGTNITFSSGTTYDGSAAITIESTGTDTQLNLTAALPIVINDLGGLNKQVDIDIDTDTMGVSGGELEVLKVPNSLIQGSNITFSSGTTYDGSAAITIGATNTDTTYTVADPITLSAGNEIGLEIDGNTIFLDGAELAVAKVPSSLIQGSNITFSSGTTYDGSSSITIGSTDTNTEYTAGTNLNLSGTTFNLDTSITNIDNITFTSGPSSTALTGNNYPSNPTTCTYLDLSSATNIMPSSSGGVLATKVQRSSYNKSFSSAYGEYSTNFRTSFVATSTNVMVEFKGVVRADQKVFYGGLYDYNSFAWQADTRNRFNFNDETDQDMTTMTWWMRNLTAGTTYYISPYFRGNSSPVYIYGGNSGITDSFAPAIMRIFDGGDNVTIY